MPAMITLGHLLMVLAAVMLLAAIGFVVGAMRHRGHGRGTPGYARARTNRRKAVYAMALSLVLAVGCLTPLCYVPIVGGGG